MKAYNYIFRDSLPSLEKYLYLCTQIGTIKQLKH